jgi:hypothetical protein
MLSCENTFVPITVPLVALVLFAGLIGPLQVRADDRVEIAIRVITTLCVSGGRTEQSSVNGLNVGTFNKREAQGLVDGINAQLSSLAADQANRARDCMRPYIGSLLALIIASSIGNGSTAPAPDLPATASETAATRLNSFVLHTPSGEFKAGIRRWARVATDRWQQEYPDGTKQVNLTVKRINFRGCNGTVVYDPIANPNLQTFLPDRGCINMMFFFRQSPAANWSPYVQMVDVR